MLDHGAPATASALAEESLVLSPRQVCRGGGEMVEVVDNHLITQGGSPYITENNGSPRAAPPAVEIPRSRRS